jgi:hypothetical protein
LGVELAVISATSTVQGTFGSRRSSKRTGTTPLSPAASRTVRRGREAALTGLYGPSGFGENAPVTERVCENCGMGDDELALVRRVYLVPPSWDTPASQTVIAEPELWCVSCMSQYPCEIVDD